VTTASDVIDQQVAAGNRRDMQGFVACDAPDAKASVISPSRDARGHALWVSRWQPAEPETSW
jgi:hypothetical protein